MRGFRALRDSPRRPPMLAAASKPERRDSAVVLPELRQSRLLRDAVSRACVATLQRLGRSTRSASARSYFDAQRPYGVVEQDGETCRFTYRDAATRGRPGPGCS